MSIVVTGATGNVGGAAARFLVEAGQPVTVLVRDPGKLVPVLTQKATVKVGSVDNAAFLREALKGAAALFWVSPNDFKVTDIREYYCRLGRAAAEAIEASGIRYVVNLSSQGAHLSTGMGPISGLHDVEHHLNGTPAYIVHLRPGFFFENFLAQSENLRKSGSVMLPIAGAIRCPMVATDDIARVAVEYLAKLQWTGRTIRGVHGPADLSFDEAAAAIGQGVGRPAKHVPIPLDEYRQHMLSIGATPQVADAYAEMYARLAKSDYLATEIRTRETTTPTTLADYAAKVLKRMVVR
jgi:uncharacterized protein YbjT (DUF2867 family)